MFCAVVWKDLQERFAYRRCDGRLSDVGRPIRSSRTSLRLLCLKLLGVSLPYRSPPFCLCDRLPLQPPLYCLSDIRYRLTTRPPLRDAPRQIRTLHDPLAILTLSQTDLESYVGNFNCCNHI